MGSCILFSLCLGFFLSLMYGDGSVGPFWDVVKIMQDLNCGWVVRFAHSSGVSIFFVLLYLHMLKGLLYGSFKKSLLWVSGVMLLVLVMVSAFLGYVLVWGGMSYWGMTVISSMLGAVPLFGLDLMYALWGGMAAGVSSLGRFFSLHYAVSLLVGICVVVHLVILHVYGSSNPLGVKSAGDMIMFSPSFWVKDVVSFGVLALAYWALVFVSPYSVLDVVNFMEVDYLKTPTHIKPEWYFLFVYGILRCVPSKLGGILLMLLAILIFCLPAVVGGGSYRLNSWSVYKSVVWLWVLSWVELTVVGAEVVEYPFDLVGVVFSFVYFASFIVLSGVVVFGGEEWCG